MSATTRRSMHVNSLAAYYAGERELFCGRETAILAALENVGPMTDREILIELQHYDDMNAVRPRITELVKDGVLEEIGSKLDPITHRNVRIVRLRPDPRNAKAQGFLFDIGEPLARGIAEGRAS